MKLVPITLEREILLLNSAHTHSLVIRELGGSAAFQLRNNTLV